MNCKPPVRLEKIDDKIKFNGNGLENKKTQDNNILIAYDGSYDPNGICE
jgi:hypothetical protein